jgi:hypothetical protein
MALSPERAKLRSSIANAASRKDVEAGRKARVAYKEATAAEYIRRLVDEAPPLTPEQRDRLAVLLRGSAT